MKEIHAEQLKNAQLIQERSARAVVDRKTVLKQRQADIVRQKALLDKQSTDITKELAERYDT